MSLVIDYKLTGSGWAECTIADGEQSCTVTASYLSDAFGDLVLSAVALLHWFNALSFSFQEEPGEFRWVFNTKSNNEIELKILDPYYANRLRPSADGGQLIFQTAFTRETFGNAVLETGKKLLEEYGEAGYLEKWVEYPFPTESLSELGRLLERLSPTADLKENER